MQLNDVRVLDIFEHMHLPHHLLGPGYGQLTNASRKRECAHLVTAISQPEASPSRGL